MNINLPKPTKKILLRIISIAMLMEMLDATVLNTALPQIAISLNINPIHLKEILTVYFLSLGIFIPVSGWVADRFGEKNSMLFAISLFTASSLACGLSVNLPMLVCFRLLQGVGGAFLMPVGRQIIIRVFPGKERLKAMVSINIVTLLGLMLGPLIGGALTTYANWRWIFFVNVPIGVLGFYLIYHFLPSFRERFKERFDWLGFLMIGLSLGAMLFLLDILIDLTISIYLKLLLLIIAIGGFAIYIPYARYAEAPLISLNLFRQSIFGRAALSSFFARLTSTAHPFLVPLLLQAGYGYTAFYSGLFTVPVILATLISMIMIERIATRFRNKELLLTVTILIMLVFASFSWQTIHLTPGLLIFQQFLMGFLLPIQFSLMNTQAYENLSEAYVSQGASVYSGIIQVSGSFGIALAALVMIAVIGPNDLQHHVPLIAFQVIFIVQSLYSLLALWLFVKMPMAKLV
jgi:EmrB/QacA subfamily drug resistance transporter